MSQQLPLKSSLDDQRPKRRTGTAPPGERGRPSPALLPSLARLLQQACPLRCLCCARRCPLHKTSLPRPGDLRVADEIKDTFRLYSSKTLNGLGQVFVLIGIPAHYLLAEYYVLVAGPTKAVYSGRLKQDPTTRNWALDTPQVDAEGVAEAALAFVRIRWPEILAELAACHDHPHPSAIDLTEELAPERTLRTLASLGFQKELDSITYRTRCYSLQQALERCGHKASLVEERDFHHSEH